MSIVSSSSNGIIEEAPSAPTTTASKKKRKQIDIIENRIIKLARPSKRTVDVVYVSSDEKTGPKAPLDTLEDLVAEALRPSPEEQFLEELLKYTQASPNFQLEVIADVFGVIMNDDEPAYGDQVAISDGDDIQVSRRDDDGQGPSHHRCNMPEGPGRRRSPSQQQSSIVGGHTVRAALPRVALRSDQMVGGGDRCGMGV